MREQQEQRPGKIRELVENPKFRDSRQKIEPDAKRMDEALRGVTFTLARKPEFGQPTDKPGIWAMPTFPWPGSKPLAIYYSFTPDKVFLEDIIITDAPDC